MVHLLIACCVMICVVGWAHSILVGAQAWENRRYTRGRTAQAPDKTALQPRVALLVPCKGGELGLADHLRALFDQDHANYELVFVVESEHDAACPIIRRLLAEYSRRRGRIVVAGVSRHSGQKVHNLLAATADLPEDIDVLAFVDSDACPHRRWLSSLTDGLSRPGVGAVTGYRWMFPQRNTLANLLLYSINSATAALYGPRGPMLIWGGSWAILRKTFEESGMRNAWHGTLSDDLVASRAVRALGLRVAYEPRCMTRSPLDITLVGTLEFLRRQFLIGRCYATRWWLLAVAAFGVTQFAVWGSLAIGVTGIATGRWYGWLAMFNFVAMYGGSVFRGWLRQESATVRFPDDAQQLLVPRLFDMFAGPPAALITVLGMIASCVGNTITWRNVRYRIARHGQVSWIHRPASTAPASGDAGLDDAGLDDADPLKRAA